MMCYDSPLLYRHRSATDLSLNTHHLREGFLMMLLLRLWVCLLPYLAMASASAVVAEQVSKELYGHSYVQVLHLKLAEHHTDADKYAATLIAPLSECELKRMQLEWVASCASITQKRPCPALLCSYLVWHFSQGEMEKHQSSKDDSTKFTLQPPSIVGHLQTQ